jgi:hypothetical protein
MALSGPSADISEAVKAAGSPVRRRSAVQQRLPLVEVGALVQQLEAVPVRSVAVEEARRRGRPKGSRNRRSEELIRFVLAHHSHPLMVLAATYSRPVEALAAQLDCKPADAMALQIRCAAEALPYFESKKPVSLQVDSRVIQLVVERHAGEAAERLPPWEQLAGLAGLDLDPTIEPEDGGE